MSLLYAAKVSERVYLLDTHALSQPRTVGAYLIKGPKPALVDCGYATSYRNVLGGLIEAGVQPSEIRYLIPTHVHLDHAGGAGRLLKEMPDAEVVAHENGVQHLVDPTRLIASATRVFGEATMRLYGLPTPIPSDRVTPVGRETSLDLGDGVTLTLIHTPGHAPHQISVLLGESMMLITADAVGIYYPDVPTLIPTTPPPSFEPSQLVASVGLLAQTSPRELLIPHFGVVKDVNFVLGETARKVPEWVAEVQRMSQRGMQLDEISGEMTKKVQAEAGVEDLPVHAEVSARTSVMGILHYLSRRAEV